jgi:hypothetical protein
MLRKRFFLLMISSVLGFSQISNADELGIFLRSCAYGTAAGALLGVASVAVSENPSGKMSNIARGASLGLYAGIGFGLYTLYGPPPATKSNDYGKTSLPANQVWLSFLRGDERIDGAQLNLTSISF